MAVKSSRPKRTLDREVEGGSLTGTIGLTYFLALFLFAALMYVVGLDGILAMTRLYGLLQRGGFVPFGDADVAVGATAPELSNQLAAQDPIDWGLVAICFALFFLIWTVKSVQFHGLARFAGIGGSLGDHARAFLYGNGIDRWLPLRVGNTAMATALVGQGAAADQASFVAFATQVLIVAEIVVFALISWFLLGASTWVGVLAGPALILVMSYFFVRASRRRDRETGVREATRDVLRSLAQRPGNLSFLLALSLLAFVLEVLVAYFISQAFTSENVLLNLEWQLVLMGVLGAHIARLIPLTPGGLGQYEWGFVLAIYVGGGGFGAATTTALVTHVVLYTTATLLMFGAMARGGVPTSMRGVLEVFRRGDLKAQPVR